MQMECSGPSESGRSMKVGLVLVVLAMLLAAGPSTALTLYPLGTIPNSWLVICNDGTMFGPWPDYGGATAVGGVVCDPHGGIVQIPDSSVEAALADVAQCAAESSVTIAREDAVGGFEPQMLADLEAIFDASGGVPGELVGLETQSLVVRGHELLPSPTRNPLPLSILEIYSDEDEDGTFVGGRTDCTAAAPISGAASWLLGAALVATTSLALRWRDH